MRLRIYDPRILALDLRLRRFGYAVFEGPRRLLDSGSSSQVAARRDPAPMIQWRLAGLLKLWSPEAIVVKSEHLETAMRQPKAEYLVQILTQEAVLRSVEVRLLGQAQLAQTFRTLGCGTKYEIASALARIFPELAWKLPSKRRAWESEAARMSVFDAIAAGLAYWQHETASVPLLQTRSAEDSESLEPFRRPLG